MINLLPFEERKNIEHDHKVRFVIVAIFFAIALVIVGIIFLVPSYAAVLAKMRVANDNLEGIKTTEGFKNDETLSDIIKDINSRVDKIALPEKDVSFVDNIILPLTSIKPKNLSLNEIFIARDREGKIQIQIGGISPDRETLLAFVSNLQADSTFKEVVFPISDYVQEKDIDFSINLELSI